jgi:hypothetical protein
LVVGLGNASVQSGDERRTPRLLSLAFDHGYLRIETCNSKTEEWNSNRELGNLISFSCSDLALQQNGHDWGHRRHVCMAGVR